MSSFATPAPPSVASAPVSEPAALPPREEHANAISHALGLLAVLASVPVLGAAGHWRSSPVHGAGLGIFIVSMLLMFAASALFHALPAGRGRDWMRRVDHAAIFVAIAGSYTPFALSQMATLPAAAYDGLLAVWCVAVTGVWLKLTGRLRGKHASTVLYLAFGWLVAAHALPLLERLPAAGLTLMLAGGLAYSAGSLFFLLDRRLRFGHLVWHLFVIAGSGCHLGAVLHLGG